MDPDAEFPNIDKALAGFEALVQWVPSGGEKVPEPVKGCDDAYDLSKLKVKEVEDEL